MDSLEIKKPDSISEGLHNMYNLGIDHAIEVIKQSFTFSGKLSPNTTEEKIIEKLNALKK